MLNVHTNLGTANGCTCEGCNDGDGCWCDSSCGESVHTCAICIMETLSIGE